MTPLRHSLLQPRLLSLAIHRRLLAAAAVATPLLAVMPVQAEEAVQSFQIAAGPLDTALNQLGQHAGILLSYRPDMTAGLQSSGLQGSYSAAAALRVLLQGSGLVAVQTGNNAFTLQPAPKTDGDDLLLPAVSITGQGVSTGGDVLPDTYAGGYVAKGGRLGVLGEQDAANVPFSVVGYTDKLIRDQQAETLAAVLDNDASVVSGFGYGNYAEKFVIRGYELNGEDVSYGGLYGIVPRQIVSTNIAERVELFKGANAFLNGVSPTGSGIGGSVNLEPKHAGDEPLTRLQLDYGNGAQTGLSADVSRRFGAEQQFGVRVNALQREGDTAIDNESRRTTLASVGLDYRGERFNTSLDVGYQKQDVDSGRSVVYAGTISKVPDAPDADTNYSPDWTESQMETTFALWRGEYQLTPEWTTYAALGGSKTQEVGQYASPTVNDDDGNATLLRLGVPYRAQALSGNVGVRGNFVTGEVSHQLNLGYSGFARRTNTAYTMAWPRVSTNIYDPVDVAYQPTVFADGDWDDPNVRSRVRMDGVSLSDTLGFMDDRLLLTLGGRQQWLKASNYTYAGELDGDFYRKSALSPVAGVMYKPWEHISVYANHIEGLQVGDTAPTSTGLDNAGAMLDPYISRQNEVGIKLDYEHIGGSVALFEITKPSASTDIASNRYATNGKQRNRGVEVSLYGEPVSGLVLNGSATWMDPKIIASTDESNIGKDAVGVPDYRISLGADLQIPAVEGLHLNGRVIRTGSQYLDDANELRVDPWTRIDLGARYTMRAYEQNLTWRLTVNNVMNENYWASATGGYLTQGAPREVRVSLATEF